MNSRLPDSVGLPVIVPDKTPLDSVPVNVPPTVFRFPVRELREPVVVSNVPPVVDNINVWFDVTAPPAIVESNVLAGFSTKRQVEQN